MVRRQTLSPWDALDQVGERVRHDFGMTKFGTTKFGTTKLEASRFETNDGLSVRSPPRSVQRGLNAELLSMLLEHYKRLASNELERRS